MLCYRGGAYRLNLSGDTIVEYVMCGGAAEIRAKKVSEAHNDQLVHDDDGTCHSQLTYAKTAVEYRSLAKDVFTNITFLMLTLFSASLFFLIAGFTAFGPKYFEFGFAMSPSLAGILFGNVHIICHIATVRTL